jgi:solute carrier family 25 aspartate/glutamate transporter 12/13
MEASIIFHFAGRGTGAQRLAFVDFARLLDPRWGASYEDQFVKPTPRASFLQNLLESGYNFIQGGQLTRRLLLYCSHKFGQVLLEHLVLQ